MNKIKNIFFGFLILVIVANYIDTSRSSCFAQEESYYDYYSKGINLMDQGNYSLAIDYFIRAIAKEPNDILKKRIYGMKFAEYLPNQKVGICYYKLGQYSNAKASLLVSAKSVSNTMTEEYLSKLGGTDSKIYSYGSEKKTQQVADNNYYTRNTAVQTTENISLSIIEATPSKSTLSYNEPLQIDIKVANTGNDDASGAYIVALVNNGGISITDNIPIAKIEKNGGMQRLLINVYAKFDLTPSKAVIVLKLYNKLAVLLEQKEITIDTKPIEKPKLIIDNVYISGLNGSGYLQNQVVDIKVNIKNEGKGIAENVILTIECNQLGIQNLGYVINGNISSNNNNPKFSSIETDQRVSVQSKFLINNIADNKIKIRIGAFEKTGKSGINEYREVELKNTDNILANGSNINYNISAQDLQSDDVDKNVPKTNAVNKNAVAVVIGNCNYKSKDVPPVQFAINDASTIKKYLINSFGFQEGNIIFETDATQSVFNSIFGNKDRNGKLFNYSKENSDVFIYYSGHGAPDPESKDGYFVPVDCDPATVALNGYSLKLFYDNIAKIKCKSLTVVIDACFSGSSDKGMLLKNISPIMITVNNPLDLKSENIIITSATADQVSSWYPEKKHSLMTYYFLKGIQGEADTDKNNSVSVGEIKAYLQDNVTYMARRLNNRDQNPQINGNEQKNILEK